MKIYITACVFIFVFGSFSQVSNAVKKKSPSDGIAAILSTLMAAAGIALLIKHSS